MTSLRQRMIEDLHLRGYAERTVGAYVSEVARAVMRSARLAAAPYLGTPLSNGSPSSAARPNVTMQRARHDHGDVWLRLLPRRRAPGIFALPPVMLGADLARLKFQG